MESSNGASHLSQDSIPIIGHYNATHGVKKHLQTEERHEESRGTAPPASWSLYKRNYFAESV